MRKTILLLLMLFIIPVVMGGDATFFNEEGFDVDPNWEDSGCINYQACPVGLDYSNSKAGSASGTKCGCTPYDNVNATSASHTGINCTLEIDLSKNVDFGVMNVNGSFLDAGSDRSYAYMYIKGGSTEYIGLNPDDALICSKGSMPTSGMANRSLTYDFGDNNLTLWDGAGDIICSIIESTRAYTEFSYIDLRTASAEAIDKVKCHEYPLTVAVPEIFNTSVRAVELNISDFSFSSTSFVTVSTTLFNISNQAPVFFENALQMQRTQGGPSFDVIGRILLDGVQIANNTLGTLTTANSPRVTSYLNFNSTINASTQYNLTIQIRSTFPLIVEVSNFNAILFDLTSDHGNPVAFFSENRTYDYTSTTFEMPFNSEINQPSNSYHSIRQSITATEKVNATFFYQDFLGGAISPFYMREIADGTGTRGTLIANHLHTNDTDSLTNYTVQSKTTGGTVTVEQNFYAIALEDSENHIIRGFTTGNESTNTTDVINLTAGSHRIAIAFMNVSNGTSVHLSSTVSIGGGASTPTIIMNSSNGTCTSTKSRGLDVTSTVGNIFDFKLCDVPTGHAQFELWAIVDAGETAVLLDEIFSGFETTTFGITQSSIALFAPSINLTGPSNNSNQNEINLEFLMVDNDNENNPCSLTFDGVTNQTDSSVANDTLTNFTIPEVSEGLHNWSVNCSDGLNRVTSETFFITFDTVTPTQSWVDPLIDNSSVKTANFSVNITVADANLLRANLTLFSPSRVSVQNFFFDQLNVTSFTFNQSSNFTIDGIYTWRLETTDDHTDKEFKGVPDVDNHKITVSLGDSYMSVELISMDPMTSLTAIKTSDRVSYVYDLGKDSITPKTRIFRLTSNERLDYRQSDYAMHFVGKTLGADFELPFNAQYRFNRVNFNTVEVEITSKESLLSFSSILGLNSLETEVNVTFDSTPPQVTSVNFSGGSRDQDTFFNATVTDNLIGIDTVLFNIDGVNRTTTNAGSEFESAPITCGTNSTLLFSQVWVNDSAGNVFVNNTGFNFACILTPLPPAWNERPVREFTSAGQGIFWSLLILVWLVLMLSSLTIKGPSGRRMFILACMQGLIGVVVGIGFMQFNFLAGLIITLGSSGVFAGLALEGY